MGRLYYNNHEFLSQAVGKPFDRYNKFHFYRDEIKEELKDKLSRSNARHNDARNLYMEKHYEISNVFIKTGSTDQDAGLMTWTIDGKTPTIIYGNNKFMDPGVTVQNGSVALTIDETKRDKDGIPIPGRYRFYYILRSTLGFQRSIYRELVYLNSPVIILKGNPQIRLERGVDSYVEYGAYVRDGLEALNISGVVDVDTSGIYTISYTCTRGAFSSTVNRSVIVEDKIPPLLSLGGTGITILERFSVFTPPTVTATP